MAVFSKWPTWLAMSSDLKSKLYALTLKDNLPSQPDIKSFNANVITGIVASPITSVVSNNFWWTVGRLIEVRYSVAFTVGGNPCSTIYLKLPAPANSGYIAFKNSGSAVIKKSGAAQFYTPVHLTVSEHPLWLAVIRDDGSNWPPGEHTIFADVTFIPDTSWWYSGKVTTLPAPAINSVAVNNSYTPTITVTSPFTISVSSVTAIYEQSGAKCRVAIDFTATFGGTAGTVIDITLPVNASSYTDQNAGRCWTSGADAAFALAIGKTTPTKVLLYRQGLASFALGSNRYVIDLDYFTEV